MEPELPVFVWLSCNPMGQISRTSEKDPTGVLYTRQAEHEVLLEYANTKADQVDQLREVLAEFATQYQCGCGHPACNNCARDAMARDALGGILEGLGK